MSRLYLAGFATFHLFSGSRADCFSGKPVLIGKTALFVSAGIGCRLSTTVQELVLYRFVQGIGAQTNGRADIGDLSVRIAVQTTSVSL
jgi:MFS family permease